MTRPGSVRRRDFAWFPRPIQGSSINQPSELTKVGRHLVAQSTASLFTSTALDMGDPIQSCESTTTTRKPPSLTAAVPSRYTPN
ncbi:hypothetical protein DTO169C6_2946 [Paecilomyces variotii]|nr:hypothetical protein DTO169C6_2946 [Paecilomyces variotii]KAJ9384192.1 hypothetical protein DTO063F5_4925 [Paecilomyces variotii]